MIFRLIYKMTGFNTNDIIYKALFFVAIYAGYYFNFDLNNKPAIMYNDYLQNKSYTFFPWDKPENQLVSQSSHIWLIVHVFDAMFHVLLTGAVYLKRHPSDVPLFRMSHILFVTLIGVNLLHAGNLPPWKALIFNGIPWIIAILTFDAYNRVWWKSLIYFIAISSAIYFELFRYMMR